MQIVKEFYIWIKIIRIHIHNQDDWSGILIMLNQISGIDTINSIDKEALNECPPDLPYYYR